MYPLLDICLDVSPASLLPPCQPRVFLRWCSLFHPCLVPLSLQVLSQGNYGSYLNSTLTRRNEIHMLLLQNFREHIYRYCKSMLSIARRRRHSLLRLLLPLLRRRRTLRLLLLLHHNNRHLLLRLAQGNTFSLLLS